MDESLRLIDRLQKIVAEIQESPQQRISILQRAIQEKGLVLPTVALPPFLHQIWLSLFLIDQESLIQNLDREALVSLLEQLVPVEEFYASLGGIVGYHLQMLSLSVAGPCAIDSSRSYYPPLGIDISLDSEENEHYLQQGIDSLPLLSEIYVVGGAADRLRLAHPMIQTVPIATKESDLKLSQNYNDREASAIDRSAGDFASVQSRFFSHDRYNLPAALFPFCGHTLLEWLIRDLSAREHLYREKWGSEVITPIAMMTSPEKSNHEQILSFCKKKNWFGRGEENIRLFEQPLVPTMDDRGKWCEIAPGKLLMKPGGHGVIWKLAQEKGIFSWLERQNRTKVLIRQINNPIAGIDRGLLTFCGVGFSANKQFGFASCLRRIGSAEGVNVVVERNQAGALKQCLTNIEYCDFEKNAIEDTPLTEGGIYSRFPSNTNILFADIAAVKDKILSCPIPGMLVNKKKVSFKTQNGEEEREVVRLESTMQNLADAFEFSKTDRKEPPTFLTYHARHKTISAIKKRWLAKGSLLETPEGCLYDWLRNMDELLSLHCQMVVPPFVSEESYTKEGPPFLFFYHPALGPLFSKIGEKIRGGKIARGSEIRLEMADLSFENIEISGALSIEADPPVPSCSGFSSPRLILKDVIVKNTGIGGNDWEGEGIDREQCVILIEGDGEFYAEGVTFSGDYLITVKAGSKVTAFEKEGCIEFKETLSVSL